MGKNLSISGIILGILTFILVVYIRFFLFTFNDVFEITLIYLAMILGLAGLIVNSIVLMKKKEGIILSIIGLILIILSVLIPILFRTIG